MLLFITARKCHPQRPTGKPVLLLALSVRHHTLVRSPPQDQRILELCTKVIAMQNSPEFQYAIEELRAALHSHIGRARDKVADMALVVNNRKSDAAD